MIDVLVSKIWMVHLVWGVILVEVFKKWRDNKDGFSSFQTHIVSIDKLCHFSERTDRWLQSDYQPFIHAIQNVIQR
jgi:hypothetical protein